MKTAHPTSACRQAQQGHPADAKPWVEKKDRAPGPKGLRSFRNVQSFGNAQRGAFEK